MEQSSMLSLMLVVGVAFFIPILLHRLRFNAIPVVVAEIIAGIIIGKSGFNIISGDQWLDLLSLLGLIFLMFLSGVEIDFSAFKSNKTKKKVENKEDRVNPFYVGLVIFLLMLVFSYLVSLGMSATGLIEEPLLMTIILSSISLGIVVPVLKEKGVIEGKFGQTLLMTAVISDFFTMILFAYYLAYRSNNTKQMILVIVLIIAVVMLYKIIGRIKDKKLYQSLLEGTSQIGTRGVFTLILFFVALSETIGMENILGAFLAGVIVSLLAPDKSFVKKLDSFGYGFLIPIFFVMVGVDFDLFVILEDRNILILIPIMLVSLYIVRVVPSLILKKWFPWKETVGSGILLSSTLSLAIVASAVSFEMGFISSSLNSAIILIVIISCFVSPVIFNKLVPKMKKEKKKVVIVGANQITLPVSMDLQEEGYIVKVFGSKEKRIQFDESHEGVMFPITEIEKVDRESLEKNNAFDADILIIATSHYEKNISLGKVAKEFGVKEIIIRSEDPIYDDELLNEGFGVFSTLSSSRMLLQAMVNNFALMRVFTKHNDAVQEMKLGNRKYHELPLRKMPYLGNVLILQIYRNEESIVPNGDTRLRIGDSIVVSGDVEHLNSMREELE